MSQIPSHRPSSPTTRRLWLLAGALFCAMAVTAPAGGQSSGKVSVGKAPVAKAAGTKPTNAPAAATAKSELIDINHATVAQLRTIPGIGEAYAKKIVAGRPFANKTQLVSRNILKADLYDLIQSRITAKQ